MDQRTAHVSARVDASLAPRLDRLARAIAMQLPGHKPNRADAVRAALTVGCEALEAQYADALASLSQSAPRARKAAPKRRTARK